MLDRHSALAIPPETAFFTEIRPRLLYRTRAGIVRLIEQWPRLADLQLDVRAVAERMVARSPATGLGAILDAYADRVGKRRGGEKTPYHLAHVPAILRWFPDAKVV